MSKKFWEAHRIKQAPSENKQQQTPASLIHELRAGRKDVSGMSIPELQTHMTDEARMLKNIREASGLPAIRPLQSEYDAIERAERNKFNLTNTAVTPPDATRVAKRKT